MVLSWSRAIYVEFVRRADVTPFMRCHVNAFEYFGGVPRRCLYDNAKVVVLGRDDAGRPKWNSRMLDFALRVGFEIRLCWPYRAQTKGKVESGVKHVRRNLWATVRFSDDAEMNRQGMEWCETVANEQAHMLALPERSGLAPYLREERKVGRDGYVHWDGVPWSWAGRTVQVGLGPGMVEIWSGADRLAVHPRAHRRGQRLTLPGQWAGLVNGDESPRREAVAIQVSAGQVERRSLEVYELAAAGGVR